MDVSESRESCSEKGPVICRQERLVSYGHVPTQIFWELYFERNNRISEKTEVMLSMTVPDQDVVVVAEMTGDVLRDPFLGSLRTAGKSREHVIGDADHDLDS